jgi:hypothetical protein
MEFKAINGIYEVDFDTLYRSSDPQIDSNFLWADNLTDYESKKEFYKTQLQLAVNDQSPLKKEGEKFLMFKVSIDNMDTMLRAGFIEVGNSTLRTHWFLLGPNPSGSRNWIYTEEYDTKHREFLAQFNVTKQLASTFVGSPVYNMLVSRSEYVKQNNLTSTRAYISDEELTDVPGNENKQFVKLTITL